jgi:hypothetical protein
LLLFIRDSFAVSLNKPDKSCLYLSADLFLSYTSAAGVKHASSQVVFHRHLLGALLMIFLQLESCSSMLSNVYTSVKAMVVDLRYSKSTPNFEISSAVVFIFNTWCSQLLGNAAETRFCDESLAWISETFFCLSDCSDGGRMMPGSESLMGVAILALSDLLYIGVTDRSALIPTGVSWVTELATFFGDGDSSSERLNSVLKMKRAVVSPACRLSCVLIDIVCLGNQNDLLSLARATLRLMDLVSIIEDGGCTSYVSMDLIQKTSAALSEAITHFK